MNSLDRPCSSVSQRSVELQCTSSEHFIDTSSDSFTLPFNEILIQNSDEMSFNRDLVETSNDPIGTEDDIHGKENCLMDAYDMNVCRFNASIFFSRHLIIVI